MGGVRRLAKFRQNVARFRLYRLRFLQENMRFAAFFKIYQILKLKFLKFDKILQFLRHLQFLLLKFHENCCFFKPIFCENFEIAAVQKDANLVELEKCCRTHIFLQNFVLIQPRTSPLKICQLSGGRGPLDLAASFIASVAAFETRRAIRTSSAVSFSSFFASCGNESTWFCVFLRFIYESRQVRGEQA